MVYIVRYCKCELTILYNIHHLFPERILIKCDLMMKAYLSYLWSLSPLVLDITSLKALHDEEVGGEGIDCGSLSQVKCFQSFLRWFQFETVVEVTNVRFSVQNSPFGCNDDYSILEDCITLVASLCIVRTSDFRWSNGSSKFEIQRSWKSQYYKKCGTVPVNRFLDTLKNILKSSPHFFVWYHCI